MTIRKKATIREVAALAGVSFQTVSRVLNNHPYVADETRQRVMEVIKKLDFRPDAIARSLSNRRTYTLGVIVAEVDTYGPQRRLNGIAKQSAALGYSLLLSVVQHYDVDTVARALDNLLAHQVDGIIWAVPDVDDNQEWIRLRLRDITAPVMFVSGQAAKDIAMVFSDGRAGARLATEHLLSQGYRQIGLITGPLTYGSARDRQLGWQDALAVAGIPMESRRIVEGDWSSTSGVRGFYQLSEQFPEMDAVLVSNDQMALGVLHAVHSLGRRVPEDLAVVGYDAIPESAHFWPPLTSVHQHLMEVGATGVRELVRLIELKHSGDATVQAPCIGIMPQLIVRRSSGG